MKGKGKKRSYKELLDENKALIKENKELKDQLCKCNGATNKEDKPTAPPPVVEGNVVSAADLYNL